MKKVFYLLMTAFVCTFTSSYAAGLPDAKKYKLKTRIDSVSYAIGMTNGYGFKQNLSTMPGDPCNVEALLIGFVTAMQGDSLLLKMTQDDAHAYIQQYFTAVEGRVKEKNKEEGESFLAENKTKEGVETTESGLQYKVMTEGDGPKPTPDSKVKVHYKGTLLDGTVFDSSYDRGEPITFGVTQVIPGWTEGLQLMSVGSKYMFWIPPGLAYGEQGNRSIPANSTLIFEVELLEIPE